MKILWRDRSDTEVWTASARFHGWIEGHKECHESGHSPAEVIGKLIISYPEAFNVQEEQVL